MSSLYAQYAALLDGVLDELVAEGALPAGLDRTNVTVEPPRDPAHGDLATNAAMVLAKAAGTNPRALAGADQAQAGSAAAGDIGRDRRAPASSTCGCNPDAWRDELAHDPRARARLRPVDGRQGRAGQCRICLGQPDRAAAHGPLPRRGGRRQPGAAARGGGLPRHQGILCQRRRGAGRYARPLGAPAVPRGARRGHRRDPRGHVPGRLSDAGRRSLLAAEFGDRYRRRAGSRMAAAVPRRGDRGDARPDPPRPRACSASTTTSSRPRPSCSARARSSARWTCCAARAWSTKATLERPKSLDPHDEWEPVELTLFRSSQFGDDQDRPMKKSDGSWTYFGSDAAYHWQKAQAPTIWSTSGAPTMPAPSSASRRRSTR